MEIGLNTPFNHAKFFHEENAERLISSLVKDFIKFFDKSYKNIESR